jgi:hypothetical protein
MIRVWGTLKREQKIISGHVVTFPGEARTQALAEILRTLCYELDIPRPVVLGKHEREFTAFGRTRFHPPDFVERVGFDQLEMEILKEDRKREPR